MKVTYFLRRIIHEVWKYPRQELIWKNYQIILFGSIFMVFGHNFTALFGVD